MMDTEVLLEALGVLCNAKVTSVQRHGVGLKAADICGGSAPELMTINHLVHRVLDGDVFRPVPRDAFAGILRPQKLEIPERGLSVDIDKDSRGAGILSPEELVKPVCKLAINIDKDCSGNLQLVVDEDDFFDPRFNYDFTKITDHQTFYRGGEVYQRPCGWKRFALKVLGKYDKDTWLGNNRRTTQSVDGEWPVSYHGTTMSGAEGIIEGNYNMEKTKREKYGRGVYSTPYISVAEGFAKKFWSKKMGKWYKVLLQNRINPEYREIYHNDQYWLVRIPKETSEEKAKEMVDRAIRPYGLLLKEN